MIDLSTPIGREIPPMGRYLLPTEGSDNNVQAFIRCGLDGIRWHKIWLPVTNFERLKIGIIPLIIQPIVSDFDPLMCTRLPINEQPSLATH